jgi:hypothetical protein
MRTSARLLGVVFACALVLTLAACSGTVTGKVTNKSSGQPIQGAVVQVGTKTATTATDGTYTIKGVPTGSQAAKATSQGYADAASQVQVKRGTNALDMALQDGSLTVTVQENAADPGPVQNAVVTLDGSKMTPSTSHSFAASDVLLGDHKVVVAAPNHETFTANFPIDVGPNAEQVRLSLTAWETSKRQNVALLYYNWRLAYSFLHPLWRKVYPYKQYVADFETGAGDSPFSGEQYFGSYPVAQFKAQWSEGSLLNGTFKLVNRTFKNLVAVRCGVRMESASAGVQMFYVTQMWKEIKGRWYLVSEQA